jgi:tryptophanyl-tRNA synthetase
VKAVAARVLESSAMTTESDTQDATARSAPAPESAAGPGPGPAGGTAPPGRRPRVFSGIQPTGALHLGNYLGAIRNFVAMQESHDCVYCVVDLHAITARQTKAELKRNTIDVANMFLASGIDPQRSIVIVQSHVAQHSELAWILNTVAYMGELSRMTQFKDKTRGGEEESIGVGIFDYPVLMAADILLYRADAVPVGEDQKQHVELTRDLAERFNNAFGKTFVVPQPIIRTEGARIMGLDDPAKKMSKSAGSAYNFIALTDSPDEIRRKIKRAVTDSGAEVRSGPDKPALSNLLTIFSLLAGEPVEALVARYEGRGYADFKGDLGELVVESLAPFQRRMAELAADKGFTLDVLRDGAERAQVIAERTMAKVRDRMGFVARP